MKSSPIADAPHLVLEGERGHLFLVNDANRCHEQHLGVERISDHATNAWVTHIQEFAKASREINAQFCFLTAPDKQSVYWGQLSAQSDHRNILEITDRLRSISVVDPLEQLRGLASNDAPAPYPKVDTHWSSYGALVALEELGRRWGHSLPIQALRDSCVDYEFAGDLGIKLIPNIRSSANNLRSDLWRRYLTYDNGVPDNGRMRLFVNNSAPRGESVLVCGDSFSYRLGELLSQCYRTVMHFHGAYFDRRLLQVLRPAAIVFEQTERFFIRPPRFSMDAPVDRLLEEKVAAGVDVASTMSQHRMFNRPAATDVNHMVFVETAERYLQRWGVVSERWSPDGFAAWLRMLPTFVSSAAI